MTSKQRCALAKKYLLELLGLTTMVKDDEKPRGYVEVPQFSEAGTYETLGKDRARTVRAILGKVANALGIPDIDGRLDRIKAISDNRAALWELQDSIADAEQAVRRLRYEIDVLDNAKDFASEVDYARNEIEQAFGCLKFSTPERTLARIARALSIDPETGRMEPKYKRDEARAKKAKK